MEVSHEEINWAVKQLAAMDYVRVAGHGGEARVSLTEKGSLRARDIVFMQHNIEERLLISLYYLEQSKTITAEEVTDG